MTAVLGSEPFVTKTLICTLIYAAGCGGGGGGSASSGGSGSTGFSGGNQKGETASAPLQ